MKTRILDAILLLIAFCLGTALAPCLASDDPGSNIELAASTLQSADAVAASADSVVLEDAFANMKTFMIVIWSVLMVSVTCKIWVLNALRRH